jgi:hypothetical protein
LICNGIAIWKIYSQRALLSEMPALAARAGKAAPRFAWRRFVRVSVHELRHLAWETDRVRSNSRTALDFSRSRRSAAILQAAAFAEVRPATAMEQASPAPAQPTNQRNSRHEILEALADEPDRTKSFIAHSTHRMLLIHAGIRHLT